MASNNIFYSMNTIKPHDQKIAQASSSIKFFGIQFPEH
jgi:hypothetical protein